MTPNPLTWIEDELKQLQESGSGFKYSHHRIADGCMGDD